MLTQLPGRWLALALFVIYLLSYAGVLHSVDELSALAVTQSLVVEGQWDVKQMAWDQQRTPPQNIVGIDGRLYSKKGLGISLLAAPWFAMGQAWPAVGALQFALLTGALITAATAYTFYRLALTLDYPPATATLGLIGLGLGTLLWPYARTLFSESLAAGGLGLGLAGVYTFRHRGATGRAVGPLLMASSGLALLLLAKSANAVVIPFFAFYLGGVIWARRHSLTLPTLLIQGCAFGLPLGLALLLTVGYNYLRFHTLLTFPLEPYEQFNTPLAVGLAGLLISPGKGLLWYMPILWLILPGLPHWRRQGRLADFVLALTASLALLIFYARWYDWPGGRAWGPRMIVVLTPALLTLCLPALDQLRQAQSWRRWLLLTPLLLSILVQLPGVLVNFEAQEALDMKMGLRFEQLLWQPIHSPLLTYWRALFSLPTRDPLWLQPYFWQQPATVASLIALVAAVVLLWIMGVRRQGQGKDDGRGWSATAGVTCLLALVIVVTAHSDPRWQEQSANPDDNRTVVAYLAAEARTGDVLLLDMTAKTAAGERQAFWTNQGVSGLPFIGWLRGPDLAATTTPLQAWVAPYARLWLVMQETVEGAPEATTERWLDQAAYRGRQHWLGNQRVVEYIIPPALGAPAAQPAVLSMPLAPIHFSNAAVLRAYRVRTGRQPDYRLVDLRWQAQPAAQWHFSIQALDSSGQLVAQIDGVPARLPAFHDQIGLSLPPAAQRLILKVYSAEDGQVAQAQSGDSAPTDFVLLQELE